MVDGWVYVCTCMCGWMDGWMDGWTDGRTYRCMDAWTQLCVTHQAKRMIRGQIFKIQFLKLYCTCTVPHFQGILPGIPGNCLSPADHPFSLGHHMYLCIHPPAFTYIYLTSIIMYWFIKAWVYSIVLVTGIVTIIVRTKMYRIIKAMRHKSESFGFHVIFNVNRRSLWREVLQKVAGWVCCVPEWTNLYRRMVHSITRRKS